MGIKAVAEMIKNALIGQQVAKVKGVSEITSNAAVAASAAAASVAAIPVTGWAMAPGVAAATYAETIAWIGSLAVAARGFDIPSGVNPVTQLHQEEMVLPADIANPLRDAIAGGGMGGDTYIIHALDAKSFVRFAREQRHVLADAVRASARDFH